MRKTLCVALLIALSPVLAGCDDADEYQAMASCRIQRLERAPASVDSDYMVPCMTLKHYKIRSLTSCSGSALSLAACYEPDGDLAIIRRNIFGKKI